MFCWVPSHIGIRGNERSETAAKSALDLPHAKDGVPYDDFKHCVSQYILSTWQDDWNGAVVNKLSSIEAVLEDWQSSYRQCRKDEVVLCRTRIGHTHLTHSNILRKDVKAATMNLFLNWDAGPSVQMDTFAQERKYIFG